MIRSPWSDPTPEPCTCTPAQMCPECERLHNLVAALVRPLQPDNTRAMAVLEALRATQTGSAA